MKWKGFLILGFLMLTCISLITGCSSYNTANKNNTSSNLIKNASIDKSYKFNLNNNPKIGLDAIYFANGKEGWAGGHGIILHTSDGGQNWLVQYTGSFNILSFDFIDTENGWALTDKSILKTTDGGKTWTYLQNKDILFDKIDFVTKDNGFGIKDGKLYYTKDSGQVWNVVNTKIKIESLNFIDRFIGWTSYNNMLYFTKDGGYHWNMAYDPKLHGKWNINIIIHDYNNIWVVYRNNTNSMDQQPYFIIKTDDGGGTWSTVASETNFKNMYGSNISNNYVGSYISSLNVVNSKTAFVIGVNPLSEKGKLTISRTIDGGNTWSRYDITLFDSIDMADGPIAVSFIDSYNGWIASTKDGNGIILNTLDGGKTWLQQYPVLRNTKEKDLNILNPVIINALQIFGGNTIVKLQAPSSIPIPKSRLNSFISALTYMGKFNMQYKVELILTDKQFDINNPEIVKYKNDENNVLGNFGGKLFGSNQEAENYINNIKLNNGFIFNKNSVKVDSKDFIWGDVYYNNDVSSVQWKEGRWNVEVNSANKPEIALAEEMVKYLQDYNLPVPLNKGLIIVNIFNDKMVTNIYWARDSSIYYINYNFNPIDALQMAVSMKQY